MLTSRDNNTKTLSQLVVVEVADHLGVNPVEMEPSLFDVIEPEALDNLFAPKPDGDKRPGGKVIFPFQGYMVTVTSDGNVSLVKEAKFP